MQPVAMPMMVKLRNVVTAAAPVRTGGRSRRFAAKSAARTRVGWPSLLQHEEVAVATEAAAGTVLADVLAVVGADEDVAVRWSFGRGTGGRQHAEVVEVVDLAQPVEQRRTR